MKVEDIIKSIKGEYVIEFKTEFYSSEMNIPEEIIKAEVVSIYTKNDKIIITIDELKNIKGLEELGYSFEVGM